MDDEKIQRRSVFYPLNMVAAWSIPAVIFIVYGAVQILMLPQGSGAPIDSAFWHPLIPYGIIALTGLGIAALSWRWTAFRDVFLSAGIVFGGGTLGFGMMMFALAERASLEDFVRAAPVAPENNYTCTRQADGTIACLNEFGEPDPSFSSYVVKPKTRP